MKPSPLALALFVATVGCNDTSRIRDRDHSSDSLTVAADRDNTEINQRDSDGRTVLPADQYENQSDVNITAEIRRIILDEEMSINADNVKIITQDGRVTLRGPVASSRELRRIEEIALEVAGVRDVENLLEVE